VIGFLGSALRRPASLGWLSTAFEACDRSAIVSQSGLWLRLLPGKPPHPLPRLARSSACRQTVARRTRRPAMRRYLALQLALSSRLPTCSLRLPFRSFRIRATNSVDPYNTVTLTSSFQSVCHPAPQSAELAPYPISIPSPPRFW
jgi:hypothetical protein